MKRKNLLNIAIRMAAIWMIPCGILAQNIDFASTFLDLAGGTSMTLTFNQQEI
ncbi:MAG: hypothetical protein ACO398_09715 [Kiritimatiellia bacterium]